MTRCGCAGRTTFLLGSAANADAQKCEYEHNTRASNRPTAQATKPVFYSHAVIVIPFRISRKLIQRLFKTKKRYFQYCESIRAQPEAAFRSGGIDYQLGYVDTLKRNCTARRNNSI